MRVRQILLRILLRIITFFLPALWLTGCAIAPIHRFGDQRPITQENRGYVLLSFGPAKSPGYATHYNILLREKPDGEAISVLYTKDAIFLAPTRPDFSNNAGEGAVYLIAIPAGNYEVHRFRAFRTNQFGIFSPDVLFPFTVKPGQTTYIGRFLVEPLWPADNPYRTPNLLRGALTNKMEQDVQIAHHKFPIEMNSLKVEKASMLMQ